MITYGNFLRTKTLMPKAAADALHGKGTIQSDVAYCYCNGYFIEVLGKKKFYLVLDRSEFTLTSLEEAEQMLYEWVLEN